MNYQRPTFNHYVGSKEYRDNFDAIYNKSECSCHEDSNETPEDSGQEPLPDKEEE